MWLIYSFLILLYRQKNRQIKIDFKRILFWVMTQNDVTKYVQNKKVYTNNFKSQEIIMSQNYLHLLLSFP